ncbi:MAG TPA: hypothetical protein VIK86_07775 [Candidatus Paceibacterota bacterium]
MYKVEFSCATDETVFRIKDKEILPIRINTVRCSLTNSRTYIGYDCEYRDIYGCYKKDYFTEKDINKSIFINRIDAIKTVEKLRKT